MRICLACLSVLCIGPAQTPLSSYCSSYLSAAPTTADPSTSMLVRLEWLHNGLGRHSAPRFYLEQVRFAGKANRVPGAFSNTLSRVPCFGRKPEGNREATRRALLAFEEELRDTRELLS